MRNLTIIPLLLITLSFLLATFVPCRADDIIYGCYKKKTGQLRIVNRPKKCLRSEVSVSWNRQGPQQRSSEAIKVYDAKARFLGHLVDQEGACVNIYMPSLKKTIEISQIDGNVFTEKYLYFENRDCAGQQLTDPEFEIIYNSGKYYVAADAAPSTVSILSAIAGNQCTNYPDPVQRKVVKSVRLEKLPFTLPVALPLRLE